MTLDLISTHDVNLSGIWDMTVMMETGLIVMSTRNELYQFSLQEGCLIDKEIQLMCGHLSVYLLSVQVAGREYLALSCCDCKDIKLMNLNKQKESSELELEMIIAFSGESVYHMCQGEENRIFVRLSGSTVLELDTSTTTFNRLRTIKSGWMKNLCYMPDPHRLLVARCLGKVLAMSCEDNRVVWRIELSEHLFVLYVSSHNAILVFQSSKNRIAVLQPGTGTQVKTFRLPHNVREIKKLCLFNNKIIVLSKKDEMNTLSYFSLK